MCKCMYMYEFYLFKFSFAKRNPPKVVEENEVSLVCKPYFSSSEMHGKIYSSII